jgi:hypothetical protein
MRAAIDKTRVLFLPGWPLAMGSLVVILLLWFIRFGSSSPREVAWLRQIRRALQDRWYDTARVRKELGWTPRVSLREAIEKTAESSK